MTLGRSSQAQNIAALRWLTFSASQPSRRRSRILRLSLIFATFETSICSSVFFSVRCRVARSLSSSQGDCFCAHQPLPTSRRLEPHLERHPCNDIARTCSITSYNGVAGACTAGAHGICTAGRRGFYWCVGELELDSLGGPFPSRVPCAACSLLQSLLALRCSLKQLFHSCAAHR